MEDLEFWDEVEGIGELNMENGISRCRRADFVRMLSGR